MAAATPASPGYPEHWEADVVLRDGGTAHVRPIRPDDADALQEFHRGQSPRSTYFRFFAPLTELSERDLALFTRVDHVDRVALVAVQAADGGPERIIAVARYDRITPEEAEVAFNVADAHHGRGLGSVLLEHLAAAARERGVQRFVADVLPRNTQMLAVFRDAGYDVAQRLEDGIVQVRFDIDPTDRSLAVMADREHRAEARSVQGILAPRAVAVVAGPGGGRSALATARALASGSFTGPVHLVGLGEQAADGAVAGRVQVWPDVRAVPAPVDLVLLDSSAETAAEMVRQCRRLGPRAVVVLSGGFAEQGPEGLARQRELLRTAHASGMRIVGPASFGVLRHGVRAPSDGAGGAVPGHVPEVSAGQADRSTGLLNATLTDDPPGPGSVGLFCQSAAMAVTLLGSVRRRGLGLSTFVSAGHRADVSGNDVMQFWQDDDATSVVGLYLESIGNPRKFSRIARRLAAKKPVVVATAGMSGHVVPPGHAVRPTRTPRRTLEELLRQCGVIRAENTHQLVDIAQLLAHQPLPTGRRVAILASSAALVALVAEAASAAGLVVSDRTVLIAPDAADTEVERQVAAAYQDPDCDAVIVVHLPTIGERDGRLTRGVAEWAARTGRTTVACVLGLRGIGEELAARTPATVGPGDSDRPGTRDSDQRGAPGALRVVPAYTTPEDAVLALAAVARYAAWRETDRGQRVRPAGIDRAAARRLIAAHLPGEEPGTAGASEPVDLPPEDAAALLATVGIAVWPSIPVHDEDEAVAAADELGWPVVLKSRAVSLRHRADLGGVRLDISDAATLRSQVARLRLLVEQRISVPVEGAPFEVQRMAPPGVACVVRSAEDPLFGPVVSFGLAGDAVDLLGDVGYGIPPFTERDVADLVRSPRAAPRLFGYRGLPAMDTDALEELLARVAETADALPELRRLELHPVLVHERGLAVLAAHVQLARAGRPDAARRVLPG